MASFFKGQSAGKSATVSMQSLASGLEAVRELFDAHRRRADAAFGAEPIAFGNACRAVNVATGFPAPVVADAARQLRPLTSVYPGDAVPSFRTAGRRLALDDVAAMDAVEGWARFGRAQQARFGK